MHLSGDSTPPCAVILYCGNRISSYPLLSTQTPAITRSAHYSVNSLTTKWVRSTMWLIHYESRTELFCTRKRGPGNHIRRTAIPKHAPRQPIQNQMPHRHKSLECLIDAKEMAGRMARWAMIMPEYNYPVEYIKGVTSTAADALSSLLQHQTPLMAFTDRISNGSRC